MTTTTIVDTANWTTGQTLPQIVFTLGVLGYTAFERRRFPHYVHMEATFAFDELVTLAKKRGFKNWRQLKGSVRYGRPPAFATERVNEVCSLLTENEIRDRLAKFSAWMTFRETGRLPAGWTWRSPESAR